MAVDAPRIMYVTASRSSSGSTPEQAHCPQHPTPLLFQPAMHARICVMGRIAQALSFAGAMQIGCLHFTSYCMQALEEHRTFS